MRRRPLIFSLLLLALSARAQEAPSPKIVERYKQMLAANPAEGTALDRLWKIYADQGQTGQLLEEYRAKNSFAAQMIAGHLLKRAGRPDDAVAAWQKAATLDDQSPLPTLALARLESDRGKATVAAEAYEKAIALLPANDTRLPETLLALGTAWLSAGDMTKASAAWEKTVALNPSDLALRRQLADTYERNFLPDRALEHLNYLEAHASATERPLALQQIARLHQNAGHQDAAIAALEKALALTGPGNWLRTELESQIIRLHQRYHRTAELEARWKDAAAKNPRDLGVCWQLIEFYERTGDLEQQREWLNKAIKLAPKNPEPRLKLVRLLLQLDQLDEAAGVLDGLLQEQPANADYVFSRARIEVQRDAAPAARQRIAALLVARKNDETIRAKALEFFLQNRLFEAAEQHLAADAAADGEEPLTALANFYFSQRRDDEARRTLQRLVVATDPPARQATARLHIAQLLRTQNDLDGAVAELEAAAKIQPENREVHFTLGDLFSGRGDSSAALAEFTNAIRYSTNETDRTEADQKLFESFRAPVVEDPSAPFGARTASSGPLKPFIFAPGTVSDANGRPPNPLLDQLDQFIAQLGEDARQQGTEAAWLRLARWQMWNRDTPSAITAANKALAVNPKSVAAYELMMKLEPPAGGLSSGVIKNLDELAKIDPANRLNYERRAGQFELQAGQISEALEIFERLAAQSPGNLDALTDLALTQQRADRWPEALATWQNIYSLSPVSRRKDALAPLLRVFDHLNLFEASAEAQLKAIDAESNERERFSLFNDLLTHCGKHELLGWLRARFEKQRKIRADDYFTEVALGRILKASGDSAAAFEVLADASYAAPNQADALPDLIREAEELHRLDAAIKLQTQLVRLSSQESPEPFEKLAQLQEKNFAIDDAAQTWERTVAKFPRDSAMLNRAVDFQLAWGTSAQAVTLLRKARALEPANAHTLSTLATLDLELGENAEAQSCLEQILRETTPEKPGEVLRFPAVRPTEAGRVQTAFLTAVGMRNAKATPEALRALRSFWVDDAADKSATETKNERDLRLTAIRQLAQIIGAKDDATRTAWIARWRQDSAPPSEALWALFYAGDGGGTLDRVEALLARQEHEPKLAQAFIWLALQSGQYDRLGTWLKDKDRTPTERDYLLIALGQAIEARGGKAEPGLINALFAEGTRLRVWQAAVLFAGRNRLHEAIELGQRVFDNSSTQRAVYAMDLAHWHLFLGEVDQARALLRSAIASPAESFDAPVCTILREYYLLLPEPDRATFVESYLAAIDVAKLPLAKAIAGALLHGLAGQESEAHADLDHILDMRPLAGADLGEPAPSGVRQVRFLVEGGADLQAMKLENLAIYFWEKGLEDEAFLQLQGEQTINLVRDMRQRLCALKVATVPAGEVYQWIETFARFSPNDGLTPLANAVSGLGAHTRAIALFRQILERDPADTDSLRNLLNACRAAGDNDTAENVLRRALSDGGVRLPDGARRELLLQLSDLLEHNGKPDEARTTLASALDSSPNDTRLLLRLGQLHERGGRLDLAISAYQRLLVFEPGNLGARLALSSIYETQNRIPDALALFQNITGPDTDARLALLQLKNGQPDTALSILDRIPPPQHVAPTLALANALAAGNDRARARTAIQAALGRTTDPKLDFPLQCKLIELLVPEDGPNMARRELRRLRRFAITGDNPSLLGSYLDFAASQAARLHVEKDLGDEARQLWAQGSGPIPAGLATLSTQLETGDKAAARVTLDQLLPREDLNESALQAASEAVEKASMREELARIEERMTQVNPLNDQSAFNLIHTLYLLGQVDKARARLEKLATRAALNEDNLGRVAQGFAEIGDTNRALALYEQLMRTNRFARNWVAMLQYAQLQIKLGSLDGAKRTLRVAFTHPANRTFVDIVDWLAAAGRLDHLEDEIADFDLTPPRAEELRRSVFAYFEKAGQPGKALALAEAHPEIIQPGMGKRLRQLATDDASFTTISHLLERLIVESNAPENYSAELARLHGDWAQSALTAGESDAALTHLRLAHEQHPELFEIATRLSALLQERGDRKGAIETLESYLAVGKISAEIDQARALLAKLKTAG